MNGCDAFFPSELLGTKLLRRGSKHRTYSARVGRIVSLIRITLLVILNGYKASVALRCFASDEESKAVEQPEYLKVLKEVSR